MKDHGLKETDNPILTFLLLEVLIDIVANLTPIIRVSDECQAQSKAYITHLFEPEDGKLWPIKSIILKSAITVALHCNPVKRNPDKPNFHS